MKILMSILVVTFSAAWAWACPGGHLKVLEYDGQVIGEINFVSNRVKITDSQSQLFYIAHVPEKTEIAQMICGSPHSNEEVCDFDQGLKIDLLSQPDSQLIVGVLVPSQKEVYFKASNFRQARGCGEIVKGTSN